MATANLLFLCTLSAYISLLFHASEARILNYNSLAVQHLRPNKNYGNFVRDAHHATTPKNSWANASNGVVKIEVDRKGDVTAPPPICTSSGRKSALRTIIVIVIMVLITSGVAALTRIFCSERVDRERAASEPRHIAEVAQHSELTLCQCNTTFTLFPWPL